MLVDLVPLVLEALELGSPQLRNPGDAAADLAVLSVGAFFFMFVFTCYISYVKEKRRSLPRSSSQRTRLTCP